MFSSPCVFIYVYYNTNFHSMSIIFTFILLILHSQLIQSPCHHQITYERARGRDRGRGRAAVATAMAITMAMTLTMIMTMIMTMIATVPATASAPVTETVIVTALLWPWP